MSPSTTDQSGTPQTIYQPGDPEHTLAVVVGGLEGLAEGTPSVARALMKHNVPIGLAASALHSVLADRDSLRVRYDQQERRIEALWDALIEMHETCGCNRPGNESACVHEGPALLAIGAELVAREQDAAPSSTEAE